MSSKLLLWWIPPALVITLFCGLIYVTGQQILRQSANDPEIQIAEDLSDLLASGIAPEALISGGVPIEISKSVSSFAAIFDDSGKLIISTGTLHGSPVAMPSGVFDYTKANGEDRFTWQPEKGVRSAVVVTRYQGTKSGYVVVGRSLRETEKRVEVIGLRILLVWLVLLIILSVTIFFIHKKDLEAVENL